MYFTHRGKEGGRERTETQTNMHVHTPNCRMFRLGWREEEEEEEGQKESRGRNEGGGRNFIIGKCGSTSRRLLQNNAI